MKQKYTNILNENIFVIPSKNVAFKFCPNIGVKFDKSRSLIKLIFENIRVINVNGNIIFIQLIIELNPSLLHISNPYKKE